MEMLLNLSRVFTASPRGYRKLLRKSGPWPRGLKLKLKHKGFSSHSIVQSSARVLQEAIMHQFITTKAATSSASYISKIIKILNAL